MIEVKGKKCFFTSIITFQLNCWVESCKFYNKLYAILNGNLIMLLQTLNVRQPLISYFRYPEQLLKIVLLWTRNFVWLTSIILFYTVQSPHKNRLQKCNTGWNILFQCIICDTSVPTIMGNENKYFKACAAMIACSAILSKLCKCFLILLYN